MQKRNDGAEVTYEEDTCAHIRLSDAPISVVALLIAAIAIFWKIHAFAGQLAPDSAGYLAAAHSISPWAEPRHPLYGAIAFLLSASLETPGYVPAAQTILHIIASLTLYACARIGGVQRAGALCLFGTALLSQSALLQSRLVMPESPAISFLMLGFAGTIASIRSTRLFWILLLPIGASVGIAYSLRPSFLPAIVAIPLLWSGLAMRARPSLQIVKAGALFMALLLPFMAQSAYRLATVSDFNIVSFGGFQMSGMAGFLLRPESLEKLPTAVADTAKDVLKSRENAEVSGAIPKTPLNSSGERSFFSVALGYFDIYARAYDDFLWGSIIKLRHEGEDWVAFNSRLQSFSVAVITHEPARWAAWICGATTRLIGRLFATNLPMIVACIFLGCTSFLAIIFGSGLGPSKSDIPIVYAVGLAWLASTAPLTVLITFPATRYIDTANTLLPAIPLIAAVALLQGINRLVPSSRSRSLNVWNKTS